MLTPRRPAAAFAVLLLLLGAAAHGQDAVMPDARDYGLMWWQDGWKPSSEEGPRVRRVQTGSYRFALDTDRLRIVDLAPVTQAMGYRDAAVRAGDPAAPGTPAELDLAIIRQGRRYRCTGGVHPRLVETGRFLQRGDVVGLRFADDAGHPLSALARLEITAWPTTLSFLLEAGPDWPPVPAGSSAGYRGNGYCFDGSNHLEYPREPAMDPERFTVALWVYLPAGTAAKNGAAWILCKGAHEHDAAHYGFYLDRSSVSATLNLAGGAEHLVRTGQVELTERRWIHLAATYDGATHRLFVDGQLIGENPADGPRSSGSRPLSLGRRTDNFSHGYHYFGLIDEVAVYPEALSAESIRDLMAGKTESQPAPAWSRSFDAPGAPALALPDDPWDEVALEVAVKYGGKTFAARAEIPRGTTLHSGEKLAASLTVDPAEKTAVAGPPTGIAVEAHNPLDASPLPVRWIEGNGWFQIGLNHAHPPGPRHDFLDSVRIVLRNDSDREQAVPVCFDQTPARAVVGMAPVLCSADGQPTGIPVQVSKNWHGRPDGAPHQGAWFHGFSLLRVPPRTALEYRLEIAHAYWGKLPAVSHAQLCLCGWGGDQQWDQVAVGSWGESICYDPDVGQNRSMIDDVRPLLVAGSAGTEWSWTANVGGGDFLVYDDAAGQRQKLVGVKTAFLQHGPVMTEVVYAGVSADGKIAAELTVSTPRAADFARHLHRLRYDVRAPVRFRRLAFYQLGADRYNENRFRWMARGNAEGLTEEWEIQRGSGRYDRIGLMAAGAGAWFSLHGDDRDASPEATWIAARGLIVRGWKARLGGRDVPSPCFAVYGAAPSAVLELAAPPDIDELKPGDFVEADLEMVILPARAGDYYGPDGPFRAALAEGANTWRMVHREAAAGSACKVDVAVGQLRSLWPLEVMSVGGRAEFTLHGDPGYWPLTVSGLPGWRGPVIELQQPDGGWLPVDASAPGHGTWQASYDPSAQSWAMTCTLSPELLQPVPGPHRFRFRLNSP